jgi:YHS domain-containing protein
VFASEENKATFEKDPPRYEIQLNGSCARMGPTVGGNPDLYTVYKGKIYIFGSGECLKLFEAAPEKYLEPEPPSVTPSAESIQKGAALIVKAVQAMGGAEKIDGITSYVEKTTGTTQTQNGPAELKLTLTKVYPDLIRRDRSIPGRTLAQVVQKGEMFVIVQQQNVFPGNYNARKEFEKSLRRSPLEILRGRKQSDFKAYSVGQGKADDAAVELVAVEFGGIRGRIGIEASTGRILSFTYHGHSTSNGEVGEIAELYSDFRTIEGLTLPFKITGTFNGEKVAETSFTVDEIQINSKLDTTIFEKPKSSKP